MSDQELIRRVQVLERRLAEIETLETSGIFVSTANVSNPPTDAELDAEFGTPAEVGAGYVALVTDAGSSLGPWWLVVSNGTKWLYEDLALAL